jgi:hypothetical protein
MHRKIDLDTSIYNHDGWTIGGSHECDHDFPPESQVTNPENTMTYWVCSICGMKACFETLE